MIREVVSGGQKRDGLMSEKTHLNVGSYQMKMAENKSDVENATFAGCIKKIIKFF